MKYTSVFHDAQSDLYVFVIGMKGEGESQMQYGVIVNPQAGHRGGRNAHRVDRRAHALRRFPAGDRRDSGRGPATRRCGARTRPRGHMIAFLTSLWRKLISRWKAHPCARCGAPSCLLYLNAGVRVVEGSGGISVGIRVNPKTPPPEWLCRACAQVAMAKR